MQGMNYDLLIERLNVCIERDCAACVRRGYSREEEECLTTLLRDARDAVGRMKGESE